MARSVPTRPSPGPSATEMDSGETSACGAVHAATSPQPATATRIPTTRGTRYFGAASTLASASALSVSSIFFRIFLSRASKDSCVMILWNCAL